jgi:hypothetical protein
MMMVNLWKGVKRGEWTLNLPGGSQVGKSNTEDMVNTAPPGKIVPVGRLWASSMVQIDVQLRSKSQGSQS